MDLKILLREFGTDCLGLVLLQFRTKRPPPSSSPPGSKGLGLFVDEFLQLLLGQVIQLHLEPEGFLRDRLVGRVVVLQQGGGSCGAQLIIGMELCFWQWYIVLSVWHLICLRNWLANGTSFTDRFVTSKSFQSFAESLHVGLWHGLIVDDSCGCMPVSKCWNKNSNGQFCCILFPKSFFTQ